MTSPARATRATAHRGPGASTAPTTTAPSSAITTETASRPFTTEPPTLETGVIDHLWIRVADLAASKRFYTGIAPAVGLRARDLGERLQLIATSGTFSLLAGPPTENLHLAIGVENRERVRDFHAFGLHAGGRDNGTPGERPEYHTGYYGAYLLDPDSNNVEAVFHDRPV